MSDLEKAFGFTQFIQGLKENKRWGCNPMVLKKESIADHSWKATVMNYLTARSLDLDLDLLKIIKLSLIHDIVESVVGDTDNRLVYLGIVKKEDKHEKEVEAIKLLSKMLPEDSGKEIYDLWMEYESWETEEAKFVKSIEKIESIDHLVYYGGSYIDLPEHIATYCMKSLNRCPDAKRLYAGYVEKLQEIYNRNGFDWKKEYEVNSEKSEDFEKLFAFFQIAQKLKESVRYDSSPDISKKDTVAEHCLRLAIIVIVFGKFYDLDIKRALGIALFHDIAEALTGEVDYILIHNGQVTKEEKHEAELKAMEEIRNTLPSELGDEIFGYWDEYEKCVTREAKFVKALDKYESISHLLYHGYENFDIPELIASYCDKSFCNFPELLPLLKILKDGLKIEYEKWGKEWKSEYDQV